ncbi:hypothetical protein A0H76_338 [Hepatospora eriocheir]|uniref:Uncharacterized protein n=1 Tax=Hepatospora eriocheir TaxID=1081669 RepID=A0A1X0QJ49_9MICR|nr:hypothetical protein A0H76_338 [Hepatospora eriocheir]
MNLQRQKHFNFRINDIKLIKNISKDKPFILKEYLNGAENSVFLNDFDVIIKTFNDCLFKIVKIYLYSCKDKKKLLGMTKLIT